MHTYFSSLTSSWIHPCEYLEMVDYCLFKLQKATWNWPMLLISLGHKQKLLVYMLITFARNFIMQLIMLTNLTFQCSFSSSQESRL